VDELCREAQIVFAIPWQGGVTFGAQK